MINRLLNEHYFSDEMIKSLIPEAEQKRSPYTYNKKDEIEVVKKIVFGLIQKKPISYKNVQPSLDEYKSIISELDPLAIEKQLLKEYLGSLKDPMKSMGGLGGSNEMIATYICSIDSKERQFIEKYFITKKFDLLVNRIKKLKSYS